VPTLCLVPARPGRADTYLLHWELLNTLLVMGSTQLYTPNAGGAPGAHPFTEALLGAADLVPALLQARPMRSADPHVTAHSA